MTLDRGGEVHAALRFKDSKRKGLRGILVLVGLCALALQPGCVRGAKGPVFGWTDRHGVQHMVVLGFGVVSRAQTNGVAALDVKAAGVVLDRGLSAGLVQRHEVEIDPASAGDLVVSIRSTPFGLTVKNFDLAHTNISPPNLLTERHQPP